MKATRITITMSLGQVIPDSSAASAAPDSAKGNANTECENLTIRAQVRMDSSKPVGTG